MVDRYNIGVQNQRADIGAYEFHIHRADTIYGVLCLCMCVSWCMLVQGCDCTIRIIVNFIVSLLSSKYNPSIL